MTPSARIALVLAACLALAACYSAEYAEKLRTDPCSVKSTTAGAAYMSGKIRSCYQRQGGR